MRRPRFQPSIQGLERRDLTVTYVSNLMASPSLLSPPNHRFVKVEVTGNVFESTKNKRPSVQFHIVDEYRRIEPSGKVTLSRLTPTAYSFKFKVTLQAKRSSQDTAGRQYYVIVGTTDADNSQGLVVPVLVPFNKVSPNRVFATATARGGNQMKS